MAATPKSNHRESRKATAVEKRNKKDAEGTEPHAPSTTATSDKPVAGNPENNPYKYSKIPLIAEKQRQIRNKSKKIDQHRRKIDDIKAKNPGKTFDELVEAGKIGRDQREAFLNIPVAEKEIAGLEKEVQTYKQVEQETRALLEAELKDKIGADGEAKLKANFLILTQFLRLAAARRMEEPNSTSDEGRALEGVLLHFYGGDEESVSIMMKLVKGVDEPTNSPDDEPLQTTYAKIKQLAVDWTPDKLELESKEPAQTDSTVANVSPAEVQEGPDVALTNGHSEEPATSTNIPTTDVADSAANAAVESQGASSHDMTISQEWVNVESPEASPNETEAPVEAPVEAVEAVEAEAAPAPAPAPAAPSNNQSWADDHPEPAEATGASPDGNDGFHQVQRNRGGNREGGYRPRGHGRGGFRGDGRGRGRGGQRGGPSRPRRGDDEQ